jgi:alkyldihydroxyacetonephosphate synthase
VRALSPPIEVSGPADEVRDRLDGRRPTIPYGFVQRLADTGAEVDISAAARVAAGRDWWPISLHWALEGEVGAQPDVVVRAISTAQVANVVRLCHDEGVPVTAAGGRSGVTGAAIPVAGGVALDLLGLHGVTDVDAISGLVTARAGTLGSDLNAQLEAHHLTLGHWPQSIDVSTVGGWVACKAVGQYSTRYGKIEDLVTGLEVVLADGRVVHTGGLIGAGPRSSTGPDLTQLFLGSEGTLGVVTAAQFRTHPWPEAERRAAWAFSSFDEGLEALRRTLRRGATPAVVRLHDADEAARNWGVDQGHLLIALDEGDPEIIDAAMSVLTEECEQAVCLDQAVVERWLERRNDVSQLAEVTRLGIVADTIEVAASWSQLPGLYRDALSGLRAVPGNLVASAHASHSYLDGGCLYFTFAGQGKPDDHLAGRETFYRRSWDAVVETTEAHRGSISHHHGIGLVRSGYLADALGEGFSILHGLKDLLDPTGILNPGKFGLSDPWGEDRWPAITDRERGAGTPMVAS